MPVLAVCDGCRAEYLLKDTHAGTKVKCKECGTVIVVPSAPVETLPSPPADEGPFGSDRFLINQQRISISEKYYVYDESENPVLFVERPAHTLQSLGALMIGIFGGVGGTLAAILLATQISDKTVGAIVAGCGIVMTIVVTLVLVIWGMPKRHIFIYTDDTKTDLLLEVFQDHKFNFAQADYTVSDPVDGVLGKFRKNYVYDFFRKRWDGFNADGTALVVAREDSLVLSLLRRLLGPSLGLLRTNFIFLRPGTDVVIGEFNRKMTLFDRYVLDLSADRMHELDRRMAVALGILLDTGEHR